MDVYKARQELRMKRIQDLEMRVVHYDRVSTDKEEQKSSMINQNYYSEEIIKNNPKWTYAGRYVDDAVSGLSIEKRVGFNTMIEDAKRGKFDFIITKEVPRFARNTLDSIQYSRELLNYGVGIWFINNNIITLSEDSEFLLTIMAGQAQDESRRISSRVKTGHRQSIKRGHVLGTDNMYGYKKENCILTIDESTAGAIRYIFTQYATGLTSTHKLSGELFQLGYKNRNGGPISPKTIQNIIRNPKYKGYFCGGKVVIEDMFTKKQRFIPEDEWISFKDEEGVIVPAIVSESLWEDANTVLNNRSKKLFGEGKTSFKYDNLFTGKIICANDGATYWLRSRGKKSNRYDLTWECSMRKKKGASACESFNIKESELLSLTKEIVDNKIGNIENIIEKYIAHLKSTLDQTDYNGEILRLEKSIALIKKKRDKILEHNLNGRLSDEDFYERDSDFKKDEDILKQHLSELKKCSEKNDFKIIASQIRKDAIKLSEIKSDELDKDTIDLLFDKIYAKPISNTKMELTFKLKIGSEIPKIYDKRSAGTRKQALKNNPSMCRSGSMSLTIYPPTEPFCLDVRSPL